MTPKRIISVALLLFVVASMVYLVIGESRQEAEAPKSTKTTEVTKATEINGAAKADGQMPSVQTLSGASDAESDVGSSAGAAANAQTGHKLIAYYFHHTQRCPTCLTIERYAEEALKGAFPEAIKTGELEWRAVNVEEPAHEHFVWDYQLTSSELVLVNTQNGQQTEWRALDRVWLLVGDELKFKAYVEAEAMAFLEQDS